MRLRSLLYLLWPELAMAAAASGIAVLGTLGSWAEMHPSASAVLCVVFSVVWVVALTYALVRECADGRFAARLDLIRSQQPLRVYAAPLGAQVGVYKAGDGHISPKLVAIFEPDQEEAIIECMVTARIEANARLDRIREAQRLADTLNRA